MADTEIVGIADTRVARAASAYLNIVRAVDDESYWPLLMLANTEIFLWHIDAFKDSGDPVPAMIDKFAQAARFLTNARGANLVTNRFSRRNCGDVPTETEQFISTMFGDVWQSLSDEVYFDETHEFVVTRFARNGIDAASLFKEKIVVDAGCGSGKFAASIARLGAKKVIGLDISENALTFARAQAQKVSYGDRLEYRTGSAHALPLADASVDMVWSNGVVHLTDNYDGCIADFARVIKPDGMLYIYVNGRFGLFELLLDTLRQASAEIPRQLFQHYLLSLGINTGRVYWMMCAFYAAYQWREKCAVEALLRNAGFTDLAQLKRGMDFDQIEQVSCGVPFADVKYGEAQLKYLARRSKLSAQ